MEVAVGILDRDAWDANADIIVVADGRRRRLTWVPRDLWSQRLDHRINAASRRGGGEELMRALGEFGFDCAAAVVVRRSATEALLASVRATVRVRRRLDFWYPLAPSAPIEDGRKLISFLPPAETLSGERLHQWIGARKSPDGRGSDLHRLARQQQLLRVLLGKGLREIAVPSDLVRVCGDPLPVLRQIDASWTMTTFGPTVYGTVGGKSVLFRAGHAGWLLHAAGRSWRRFQPAWPWRPR